MNILLALASLSGNTRDVARSVALQCEAAGHVVTWVETDLQRLAQVPHAPGQYDLFLAPGAGLTTAGARPQR